MGTFKYNKSGLMKMAWKMFKAGKKVRKHVLSFAECLKESWAIEKNRLSRVVKMANLWNKAQDLISKRDEALNIRESRSLNFMAESLVNYYSANTYNGD